MNVASSEHCQNLYKLSGWDTASKYLWVEAHQEYEVDNGDTFNFEHIPIPAYDAGFLLSKLPGYITITNTTWDDIHSKKPEGQELDYRVFACYQSNVKRLLVQRGADTPEDALCQLAIEVFKQGILIKETK